MHCYLKLLWNLHPKDDCPRNDPSRFSNWEFTLLDKQLFTGLTQLDDKVYRLGQYLRAILTFESCDLYKLIVSMHQCSFKAHTYNLIYKYNSLTLILHAVHMISFKWNYRFAQLQIHQATSLVLPIPVILPRFTMSR